MRMLLLAILLGLGVSSAGADADGLDPATLDRYAQLALRCVHQQYPNHLSLAVGSDADVMPPYPLHPSFYGCLDWHSSVHGHWLLARLLRLDPKAPYASEARRVLEEDLSPGRLAGEVQYFANPNRASFERPYGLAWLLTLAAELRRSDDPDARRSKRSHATACSAGSASSTIRSASANTTRRRFPSASSGTGPTPSTTRRCSRRSGMRPSASMRAIAPAP
jgi:Protein of unknown function (DUF2891)